VTLREVEGVGHCTRYIPKIMVQAPVSFEHGKVRTSSSPIISPEQKARIENTPSFYIGTCTPESDRMEMSHRGGPPGFVRVYENTVVWPEYRGNGQLSTQGNLRSHPYASLLLPFCKCTKDCPTDGSCNCTHSVFEIIGTCECTYTVRQCLDDQDIECHMIVKEIRETKGIALDFCLVSNSAISPPVIPDSGGQTQIGGEAHPSLTLDLELAALRELDVDKLSEADSKHQIEQLHKLLENLKQNDLKAIPEGGWLKPQNNLVTIHKGTECAPGIKSYIIDSHGKLDLKHKPGQYVNVVLEGGKNRYWTISNSPQLFREEGQHKVEITVKLEKEGPGNPGKGGSQQLWNIDSDEGLKAELLGIDGEMCVEITEEGLQKKLLFLSSGIGITPFLCIARGLALAHKENKAQCKLDVLMLHSTRGLEAMPYLEELREISKNSTGWNTGSTFRLVIFNTAAKEGDRFAFDVRFGRCGGDQLTQEVPDILGRRVMICGATAFTNAMLTGLAAVGIHDNQIQTEAFDF